MTATERLRALLDERGVEWMDGGEGSTVIPAQDAVPRSWNINVWPSGKDMGDCLWVENRHPLTPEQAVEATLGRGTCHKVKREDATDMFDHWVYGCSECGAQLDGIYGRYCPNCGRRVEC